MATQIQLQSTNYNGQLADITFYPCSGGSISLGVQTIPYTYTNDNYEGTYDLFFSAFSQTCQLVITCPTPTPTTTTTPTVTPTNTPTPTTTTTPTVTPTNTPTVTPTNTSSPTPTPTLTPTSSPVPTIPLLVYLDAANPSSYPASGTIWYDLSGNGNDADLYGSFDYVSSGISSYFGFTGDTSYSVISGFSISNNTSLEIMMSWYGPISGTYNRMWSTGPSDNFEIGVDSGGAISVYPSNGWQNFVSFFDSVGVCRHFVFTLDGTTMKVYRDGILASTSTLPSPMTAGVDTYIATRYNNSEPTEIDVKYIKVYDAILDATQVATQYSNNSSRC